MLVVVLGREVEVEVVEDVDELVLGRDVELDVLDDVDELVLGRDVELDVLDDVEELVLGREVLELVEEDDVVVLELVVADVEVDVELVVGFVVDVEDGELVVELDEVLVGGTRVDDVLVVDVEVVVVFRFRASVVVTDPPLTQAHAVQV